MKRTFIYFHKRSNFKTKHIWIFALSLTTLFLTLPLLSSLNDYLFPYVIFDFQQFNETPTLHQPALQKLCNETSWKPDLYLNCHSIVMGTFNAINKLEVCVRWAIDAGAGMIRPDFVTRGGNLSLLWGDFPRVKINYLLDEEFLWKTLEYNCPKMRVRELSELGETNNITGGKFSFKKRAGKGEYDKYARKLRKENITNPLPGLHYVLHERDSLGGWERSTDSLSFQFTFHELFQFHPRFVEIANNILAKLPLAFFGVHLRLESDWTTQTIGSEFIDLLLERNATRNTIVYVACGDPEKFEEYQKLAKKYDLVVKDKWDLMDTEYYEKAQKLSFDQMGVIDYIVLKKATFFIGVASSSMSHSLGQSRHLTQFGNMNFRGKDYQQYLIGKQWLRNLWIGNMW